MTTHSQDQVLVLVLEHELYGGPECDEMERQLMEHARAGRSVVVDLARVRKMTARCLGILASAHLLATVRGGHVAICGVRPPGLWLLRQTGLSGVLTVHEDVAAALRDPALRSRAVA